MTKTAKRGFGDIGENVACVFLEKHGFMVLERNYLRKWGEIDIVCKKGSKMHFVEVKSVSSETSIRGEENMHPQKIKRLERAIQTYLAEKKIDMDWQLDLVLVNINMITKEAKVQVIENVF